MNHVSLYPVPNAVQDRKPTYTENILGTIGQTPLVRLNRVTDQATTATALAKVEFFNPGGSVKDRVGLSILEDAERKGLIQPGGTVVEATSGNTGAGLAITAAVKGYRCVFVMPDKMSTEKVRYLRALGARVIITPTAVEPDDPRSYYSVARRIVQETPNSLLANQYHNPANPAAHYRSTGPEIWEATAGEIDVFVAGMGTGGTISGTGRFLKEQNPDIKIVGVDIEGSLLYETWKLGRIPQNPDLRPYMIEGIGEDFVPSTLDLSLVDEVVQVDDRESFQMIRRLVKEEGIFAGGSSGSAVAGLLKSRIVRSLEPGKIVVVLLPDSGDRYLSKVFDNNWMRENGFLSYEQPQKTVGELLQKRNRQLSLVTARPEDRLKDVVKRMKQYDISQVPVVDESGQLLGLVTEVDLLEHLLHANHTYGPDETLTGVINPNATSVSPSEGLETILPSLEAGQVILVTVENRPIGILTKIDLIDYLTSQVK